jgi:uncharacterized repeat protein (TIGR01451 family)
LFPPTDATCSGAAAYTFTDGSSPYAAPGFVSNAVGTWHWTADYAGDANNNATSSACADETAVVTTASPSIGTTLSSSSISVGGSVHDSVTYTAYTNNLCTLGARDAGTVTVAAGVVPDSNFLTFNAAGDYYWQAVYSGDGNNDGATSLCSSEHLVVGKIDPTVTTAIYNETTEQADVLVINIGDSVYDIATVTSTSTIPITGTVDFLFYSTIDCTGSSTLAGVDVALTGGVATSTTQLPLIVGAYSFRAHYSGDSNFNSADSACEPLTVNLEGLFDPPFGIKTVNAQGLPVLTWTMVWINNANHVPIAAAVHDPIPNGSTYVAGSLTCTPSGTSTTNTCVFEAPSVTFPRGRIVWSGVIVDDFGATTALAAANEITIVYSVTVSSSVNSVRNIATIDSDLNGNGNTDDPGEQNVFSASARWARFGEPSIPGTGFAPGQLTFLPTRVVEYKGIR